MIVKSFFLFVLSGIAEIGGGYLMWQWVRSGKPFYFGILGGLMLVIYGLIPPFQPAYFGRAYAAYGGVFVVLSLLWSAMLDGIRPDFFDLLGGLLCLVGVAIIMYFPR